MATDYFGVSNLKIGKRFKYKYLTFYACNGLVMMHDDRPQQKQLSNSVQAIRPTDLLQRATALRDYANKLAASDKPHVREECRITRRAVADMAEAVKEARAMGDPSDPVVILDWLRQHNRRPIEFKAKAPILEAVPQLPKARKPIDGETVIDMTRTSVDDYRKMVYEPPRRKSFTGF